MSEDLSGRTFGEWTIVRFAHITTRRYRFWLCKCSCGTERTVEQCSLLKGRSGSCGCAHKRNMQQLLVTHGQSRRGGSKNGSGAYQSWCHAKARCHNPNDALYKSYGARGITMAQSWRDSFEAFFAELGERPSGLTLDRIDNSRGYEPGNCRWADKKTQRRNQRRTKLTIEDVQKIRSNFGSVTAAYLAHRFGVSLNTIHAIHHRVLYSDVIEGTPR